MSFVCDILQRKVTRTANNHALDKALYNLFVQKGFEEMPVSHYLIWLKANEMSGAMNKNTRKKAMADWLRA